MDEEALLPSHVFAPMSRRQSGRSPENKYGGEQIIEARKLLAI